jgi:hypothetical protein
VQEISANIPLYIFSDSFSNAGFALPISVHRSLEHAIEAQA